jgi:caa(3)-type oxidase subunit IV
MDEHKTHIKSYEMYVKTVIILLVLAALNIIIATIGPVAFKPVIIMLITCVQAFIALAWLMHLKFDNILFRSLVIGVFVLFFVTIVILFLDYNLR